MKIFGQDSHIARVQRSYAEAQLSMFAEGADNMVKAVTAVERARQRDYEKASSLEARLLRLARYRAIDALLEQAALTPGQEPLVEEVLELFDQIPSKDGIIRVEDWRAQREKLPVRVGEYALAFSDIGYATYILTLEGQTERPEDGDLASVGRPTLTLSDTVYADRDRHVGILFSEGTFTADSVTGMVIASTLGDNGYNPIFTPPEIAHATVTNDYASLVAAAQETLAA